jgi:hypothetical protein
LGEFVIAEFDASHDIMFDKEGCEELYKRFVNIVTHDTLFSLRNAIEAFIGRDFYLWGEVFPGHFGAREKWSKWAITAYKKALKDIKNGRLISSESRQCEPLEYIYEYGYEIPIGNESTYYIKFGHFFSWAVHNRVPMSEELASVLEIALVQDPPLTLRHVQIQAAMQTFFHYFKGPISKISERKEIKKWLPGGCASHNTIRKLAASIDPCKDRDRNRSQNIVPLEKPPHPIPIPGIFLQSSSGVMSKKIGLLIAACEVITETLGIIRPEVTGMAILQHPLISLYLGDVPFLLKVIVEKEILAARLPEK